MTRVAFVNFRMHPIFHKTSQSFSFSIFIYINQIPLGKKSREERSAHYFTQDLDIIKAGILTKLNMWTFMVDTPPKTARISY